MGYSEILRLRLSHEYFGAQMPPLDVRPTRPNEFSRAGLLLRQRGRDAVVIVDDDRDERPTQVGLTLIATSGQLIDVTQGFEWGKVAMFHVPLGQNSIGSGDADNAGDAPAQSHDGLLAQEFAQLDVELEATGPRDVALELKAVKSVWAYHVTGARDLSDLQIVDSEGDIGFEDLGLQELPDGRSAKVVRSAQELVLQNRPTQRFSLQRPGPFGPEILIPILPAAGSNVKPTNEPGAPARLQSDIFVTLW